MSTEVSVRSGKLNLIDGDIAILKGITALKTLGHLTHHQSPQIDGANEHALFLGDTMPTVTHVPLGLIIGYNTDQLHNLRARMHRYAMRHTSAGYRCSNTTPSVRGVPSYRMQRGMLTRPCDDARPETGAARERPFQPRRTCDSPIPCRRGCRRLPVVSRGESTTSSRHDVR